MHVRSVRKRRRCGVVELNIRGRGGGYTSLLVRKRLLRVRGRNEDRFSRTIFPLL